MRNKYQILLILSLFSFFYLNVNAQNPPKFIPMKSTCQDVRKVFPEEDCTKDERIIFNGNEKLHFFYTTERCPKFYGRKWNVPIKTVSFVRIVFKVKPSLEELGIKFVESEYNTGTTDVIGLKIFEKKDMSFSFRLFEGLVEEVSYNPSRNDKSKMCKPKKS